MPADELERLTRKVDKILFYLYNDNDTNTKGLVQQVKDLSALVEQIQTKMVVSAAKRAVWNTVFGAIGGSLLWFIERIIVK